MITGIISTVSFPEPSKVWVNLEYLGAQASGFTKEPNRMLC